MTRLSARLARLEAAQPPLELLRARAALADLGRGLAAVVELLDGRPARYVPGPELVRAAEADRGSLLGALARALTGSAS